MRIWDIRKSLPASQGIWPGMGGSLGRGAQRPWCGCITERVPQRPAGPAANKRALHSLHQHRVWGAHVYQLHTNSSRRVFCGSFRCLIDINVVPFFPAALARADQEHALQLLIFLLPPCNSDTLQRLLRMLSTVAEHADDSIDCEGQKVTEECSVTQLVSEYAFIILLCSIYLIFINVIYLYNCWQSLDSCLYIKEQWKKEALIKKILNKRLSHFYNVLNPGNHQRAVLLILYLHLKWRLAKMQ